MKSIKKIIITLLISTVGAGAVFSQSGLTETAPALSSQIFSRINFNPAGMGNTEKINLFSLNRLQWLGFEGHPTSCVLNLHYFNESIKSGFGGAFSYDAIDSYKAINAKFAYSYNLDINPNSLLSLGVSAGINQLASDHSNDIYDITTDFIPDTSSITPDFNFGVEYSYKDLLIGAAINHIGQMKKPNSTNLQVQSYYAYARYLYSINKEWDIAPSFMYANISQLNVMNLSAVAYYNNSYFDGEYYWAGLGYRFGSALSFMVGMEWDFLRIAYTYELPMGDSMNLSANTHELMLSFIIPVKADPAKAAAKGKKRRR
ncbi:MAG: type IX secretion system membrane protein PorP/SprF [Prevotellaceae bacterium]|jgi:type IX secretion system PorP/SprF family membrane protein|nr:type IX secretion system membrane protein PorP/SprF [Prevotellaceae bacterium]